MEPKHSFLKIYITIFLAIFMLSAKESSAKTDFYVIEGTSGATVVCHSDENLHLTQNGNVTSCTHGRSVQIIISGEGFNFVVGCKENSIIAFHPNGRLKTCTVLYDKEEIFDIYGKKTTCLKDSVMEFRSDGKLISCGKPAGECNCSGVNFVQDSDEIVKKADWKKMQTLTINLTEYSFTPDKLIFKTGIPYRLQLVNNGGMHHYFTAEDFFKAIATRKAQSSDGEFKAPYFKALEVYQGKEIELYFVPVKKGKYEFKCTVEGHAESGMTGEITIE